MGLTIVLSGSAPSRAQAAAALRQAGFSVDASDESHGFQVDSGQSFITAHGESLDAAADAVRPLQWAVRSYWAATGQWQKIGGVGAGPDPLDELAKLKSQLRAAGINIGD